MSRVFAVLVVFCVFLLPFAATAQEYPAYQTGTKELTLSGSGASDNDFDTTNLSFDVGFGYFFNQALEGILRQTLNVTDQPGENAYNATTRLGLDYNFNVQQLRPFVGATVGYIYGDGVKESFIAGPEAGIKAFLSESTFVIAAVGYDFLFEDADEADDAFDDGFFNYRLGLGYRW